MRVLFHPPKQPGTIFYNFPALTDPRQLAPENYRVATLADIQQLIEDLGGAAIAGGKLKALTTWSEPNTAATNETGFSALPEGYRTNLGIFTNILLQSKIWIDNR